jgi:hypothetical protein
MSLLMQRPIVDQEDVRLLISCPGWEKQSVIRSVPSTPISDQKARFESCRHLLGQEFELLLNGLGQSLNLPANETRIVNQLTRIFVGLSPNLSLRFDDDALRCLLSNPIGLSSGKIVAGRIADYLTNLSNTVTGVRLEKRSDEEFERTKIAFVIETTLRDDEELFAYWDKLLGAVGEHLSSEEKRLYTISVEPVE